MLVATRLQTCSLCINICKNTKIVHTNARYAHQQQRPQLHGYTKNNNKCHTKSVVQKAHKCKVCDKTFNLASSPKTHVLTHMRMKIHKCEACDKTFSHDFILKTHLLTHTGQKAHQCQACDETFSLFHHLKTHVFIHTRQKAHKCKACGKTFPQAGNLQTHIEGT